MATKLNTMKIPAWVPVKNARAMAAPILIVMMLAMMVLPLPAFMLDLLFSFNISLSVIVLMTALYTVKPLDFIAFPAVLLVSTMLRLSLNVASTRVVLTEGHTGPDAAGKVIEAFGHFLIGGNYTVGIVVFVILTIINFMVVTKGAGRIAEVGARFTLDAMPGKQMAIDADLNAGLIGEPEARARRKEVAQESEFYGAMDGASKYVRGDAVAGIIVTVVNIVGGLVVGMVQHDLAFDAALKNYTLLAIGDGLVAQIPSLIISTAAGVVVSRVANDQDVGGQLINQLFAKPEVLYITAVIIGGMGLIPGMPHIAFILLAAAMGGGAYAISKRVEKAKTEAAASQAQAAAGGGAAAAPQESEEATWNDVMPVDTLGLEVGYRLIPLVDKGQGGELLKRIKGIRKKFAQEVGFLSPPIHIRDNLELKPSAYRITLKGVEVGNGEAHAGQYLAINPGMVTGPLPGMMTTDPAFGLPAVWIDNGLREQASTMGYTVVDAGTVVATHLNHLITTHAAELLGRQEVQSLLDHLAKDAPKLVEDLVPKMLPLGSLQKVLQNLLIEGVHIRDMRTIIETLAEHAARIQDPTDLTAIVRIALGRAIVQQMFPGESELPVMALDSKLERLLMQALQASGESGGIEPGLADSLVQHTEIAAQRQEQMGYSPVLLVGAPLRTLLARFLRRAMPQLRVLSHAEVPESKTIKVTSLVGGQA
ncbi:flagellar biosynthesis protein FlhA [Herbaspirillum seropedicae]|uniref:Flagellar biosynthesis protein FlhA n=1 Tax=Herbaspirillum seropedicae (strain SmR1) TaxID=757424 RepID=D8ISI2_HERSS|nr:flagellar biosynthesis protein FlhA [Herbaspirillum seropedicae]ADJ63526.1 flagellar biosynthesis FlhA transmembrane protein [Herbaspirillum seropedicae SmR1]AKN65559.1 flagellar biosynthesis protein FlhA [Herbaspirillum seropedicae]AON54355.1 flagellar biosynthesis FlhA transmembrane protein [Herbaspirillum seropedicae]MDR6394597.1 flagellar biosynthesis protein FlhA [Herbaspirillum seropedicae]NQE28717.1 flagellar biosynthesis protein FlhA [Herbaspirillum seropedicae]